MSTLTLGHSPIDPDSSLRITTGSIGLFLLITEGAHNSNYDNIFQTQFAGKVLTHEQALVLRDLLNKQYPNN